MRSTRLRAELQTLAGLGEGDASGAAPGTNSVVLRDVPGPGSLRCALTRHPRLRAHLHLALGMPQQRDQTIASPKQMWSLGRLSTRLGPCCIMTTCMLSQRILHALLQSRGCSSWSGCGVRCRRPPPPTRRWRAGCSWGRCGRGWRRRALGSSLHRRQRHRRGKPKSTSGCPTCFNELLFVMFVSAWPL